jgi:hypothetical protein
MKNYYLQVVKRQKEIKRNPILLKWAKEKKLTGRQITRASFALAKGKGNF